MKFLKENFDRLLGLIVILLLTFTGVRMLISLTLQPGEKAEGAAAALRVESAPVAQRKAYPIREMVWSFDGFTGTYDKAAVVRGLEVYRQVCATCHSLNYVAFRNLLDLGYSEGQVKAIAASYQIPAIDENGDPTEKPGTLTDYFPNPYANENAAKAVHNGKVPPDLSLMAKAREGGPDYIYSLLTGFQDPPADFVPLAKTTTYNPYFEGWEIGMAAPLYEGATTYSDGTTATIEQMAFDVSNFLMWAAEPKLEARHEMGLKVFLFTLAMTIFFFLSMKTIWRRVKK